MWYYIIFLFVKCGHSLSLALRHFTDEEKKIRKTTFKPVGMGNKSSSGLKGLLECDWRETRAHGYGDEKVAKYSRTLMTSPCQRWLKVLSVLTTYICDWLNGLRLDERKPGETWQTVSWLWDLFHHQCCNRLGTNGPKSVMHLGVHVNNVWFGAYHETTVWWWATKSFSILVHLNGSQ